jgi:bifunctional UDP-N-acetylglucosamine pyrophosphorylase/glucosamine-1-phosphate N-acetyltransferase
MGKPLIWWTLKGLEKEKIKEVFIVQSPKKDIEKELKKFKFKLKINFLIQRKPLGTGNALYLTRNYLKEPFFVLNGDVVCSQEVINEMKKSLKKLKKNEGLVFGQETQTPSLFGMIKEKNGKILEIVEKPKVWKEKKKIKVSGIYYLTPKIFYYYEKVKKGQTDFELALNLFAKKEGLKLALSKKKEEDLPTFLKYPWHLFKIRDYLFKNFLEQKIEENVKISKNVILEGKIFIGKGTKIFEGTTIKGPCYIGENCIIGSYTLVREKCNFEENCAIGAFCETKNVIFQKNCTTHSGYLGDSILGNEVKIGAGIITSNIRLDRKEIFVEVKGKKVNTNLDHFGTVIGDFTILGSRINIMPGKLIGPFCIIYPNSLISKNVKEKTIFKNKNFGN